MNKKIKDISVVDVNEVVSELNLFWAHKKNDDCESLISHCKHTLEVLKKIDDENNFFNSVNILIGEIVDKIKLDSEEDKIKLGGFLLESFVNAVYLHDIGKISVGYQWRVLNNCNFRDRYSDEMLKNHSPHSTRIFLEIFFSRFIIEYVENEDFNWGSDADNKMIFVLEIILEFSNSIFSHHNSLISMRTYKDRLKKILYDKYEQLILIENIKELQYLQLKTNAIGNIVNLFGCENEIKSYLTATANQRFVLNKILYSAVVASDSIATTEYMNDVVFKFNDISIDNLWDSYKNCNLYKMIDRNRVTNEFEGTINGIRCEIFYECEKKMLNFQDKRIVFVPLPTGGGKTNIITYIGIKSIEKSCETNGPLKKLIYAAPFNSINNQTEKFLNDIIGSQVTKINYVTPIKENTEEYGLSMIDFQLLNYPITLISHVKLFKSLFGISRTSAMSFIFIFNSVIALDEIQAYNINVWSNLTNAFDMLAKYLNLRLIISSATLPQLDKLIDEDSKMSSYVNIFEDSEKYFNNKCFSKRIKKYNYEFLDEKWMLKKTHMDKEEYTLLIFDSIIAAIKEMYLNNNFKGKVLVEFITRKSCRRFYEYIKYKVASWNFGKSIEIRELTSADSEYYKNETIELAKKLDTLILVTTPTLEAGVDIDMGLGFKDISYLDNEIQFVGRVGREYDEIRYTEVIFFDLDDEKRVLGNNFLKHQLTLRDVECRKILESGNIGDMYLKVLSLMENEFTAEIQKKKLFVNSINTLDYKGVKDSLNLIENKNEYTLFFPLVIKNVDISKLASCSAIPILNQLQNSNVIDLDGYEVWNLFREKAMVKDYIKRNLEMSNMRELLSFFCYKYKFYGNDSFDNLESLLNYKGLDYTVVGNIFFINLNRSDLSKMFDDNYKFNIENFEMCIFK